MLKLHTEDIILKLSAELVVVADAVGNGVLPVFHLILHDLQSLLLDDILSAVKALHDQDLEVNDSGCFPVHNIVEVQPDQERFIKVF